MRQKETQNNQEIMSMEEYLGKRQEIRKKEGEKKKSTRRIHVTAAGTFACTAAVMLAELYM